MIKTMPKYTNLEKIIKIIEEKQKELCPWDEIISDVKNMLLAGVISMVRCKDCKHAYINRFSASSGVAFCSLSRKVMQQDAFCLDGEKG